MQILGRILNLKKSSKGDKKHKKEVTAKIALLERELQEKQEMKSTLASNDQTDNVEDDMAKLSMGSDQKKPHPSATNTDDANGMQAHVSKSQKKKVSDNIIVLRYLNSEKLNFQSLGSHTLLLLILKLRYQPFFVYKIYKNGNLEP